MRIIKLVEVEQVSGAGAIADAFASLGAGFGAVIDAINCNNNGCAEKEGKKLGLCYGQQIEADINKNNGCCKPPKQPDVPMPGGLIK